MPAGQASCSSLYNENAYKSRSTARESYDPSLNRSNDHHTATQLAHTTLDTRLTPFWSKAIAGRPVALAIYTMGKQAASEAGSNSAAGALYETTTQTDEQGLFTHHFVVPWERLCTHPPSMAMAFHDPKDSGPSDWQLLVRAEMQQMPMNVSGESGESNSRSASVRTTGMDVTEQLQGAESARATQQVDGLMQHAKAAVTSALLPTQRCEVAIAISEPKGVRVISDLVSMYTRWALPNAEGQDDTIKHSDILAGPREVFR